MAIWGKTKAQRVEKLIQNAINALSEYNQQHEKITHTFKGSDLPDHQEAKNAENALWGVKGTFTKFVGRTAIRRKRSR